MAAPSRNTGNRNTHTPPAQSRESVWPLVMLLAAGLLAIWQLRLYRLNPGASAWAWGGLVVAALEAGYLLVRLEGELPKSAQTADGLLSARYSTPIRRASGLYLIVAAVVLAYIGVSRLWLAPMAWLPLVQQGGLIVALLLSGSVLIGHTQIGHIQIKDSTGGRRPDPESLCPLERAEPGKARLIHGVIFVGILLLAIFLRTHRLDQPAIVFVDETNAALDAISLLEGRLVSPFATGWYETPNGFIYAMAGLFKLLGVNYLSLKLVSLLPAILTVPAVYLLARELFGRSTGLIAMYLIAVNRWHLTMSRWGWNEVATPLFFALSAFFLLRGLRTRRALDFALGGLLAGLMSYTYLSSRLALATLALFGCYWLIAHPQGVRVAWRRAGIGLLLYALVATVIVAPLFTTYLSAPQTFWNRSSEISILGDVTRAGNFTPLWENLFDQAKMFYQQGDPNGRHNVPYEPQADPITGLFLAVGLAYALLRMDDRRRGLLFLWLLFGLAGSFLSERLLQPNSYRSLNASIAVVLLAGDTLERVWRTLAMALGRALHSLPNIHTAKGPELPPGLGHGGASLVALACVCGVLLAAGAWDVGIFFGRQLGSPRMQSSFSYTEMQVAQEVVGELDKGVGKGADVSLTPRLFHFSPLRFFVWAAMQEQNGRASLERLPYRLIQPATDLPVPATGGDALFLLDPHYESVTDYIRYFYPNAAVQMVQGPAGGDSYLRVRIPADDLAALQGLNARVRTSDGSVQNRPLAFHQNHIVKTDVISITWTGGLHVESSGRYDLVIDGDGHLVVDNLPWTESRFLGQGLHRLEIEQIGPSPISLLWHEPDGSVEAVPASALFNVFPPEQGLKATYYANEGWSGQPLMEQITPFLLLAWPINQPTVHPFSAKFTGLLHIDVPGFYQFRLLADDGVRFVLDGAVMGEALVPDQPNGVQVGLELTAGEHPIVIDYFQRAGGSVLEFLWSPPNSREVPVPPSALSPGP